MMRKVDKSSPIPLYYQLKTIISEMVENEEYKPGDMIPCEREFCEIHGISRMTVSKTISSLVNEGVLYRERGKGTFVAKNKENLRVSTLLGFTEDMQRRGKSVSSKMLGFERLAATKKLDRDLQLPAENKSVFKIVRLRCCEDEPYVLETVYIAAYLCNELTEDMLDQHSLYEVLSKQFGCNVDYAYQTIEPIRVSDYERGVLGIANDALALLFTQKTYLKENIPIEATKAIYRSDRYKFEVELHRQN